ncbi:MAG TPA: zinc-binding dehydrogenase [Actinomycetaceae bacterium]|nr:zinc-binding dehydrogenase [Actinomycetaceae bacterium]
MQAWQFTNTNEPLVLNDVPEPEAAPGAVVIDIKAAGLCHSDVGLMQDAGWLETLAFRPITIGHEVAGVVSEVGEGVTDWSVGDRVAVCPTTPAGAPGYVTNGGFSHKMTIDQQALVRIPDDVGFIEAATATDAGMTSYHALTKGGEIGEGDKIGIIGLGGLGQIAARAAVLKGAEVYVAEVNEKAWELGEEIGIHGISKSILDFKEKGLDKVIDYAGFGETTADAIEAVKIGGVVVLVGMGKLEANISTIRMILSQVTLIGSNGGTPQDVADIMDLYATGGLKPKLTIIGFDDIPQGIDDLKHHRIVGRLVAKIAD